MNKINFLIIGLGSMGKRRIRNLLHWKISKKNIFGFDISPKRCKEIESIYDIKCYSDFNKAVNTINPDAYIISTPPNKHLKYSLFAAKSKKHFFTEVDTSTAGYGKLFKYLDNSFVAAPSCTFRYFSPIKKIKSLIDKGFLGKLLLFNYHMGQYLPSWHPWEDYRKVYFSQKQTSAIREMIPYELNWIQWVTNSKISKIIGIKYKLSNLDMKAEDVAISILKMSTGTIGSLTIDVISQLPIRRLLLIGDKGQLEWIWKDNIIKYFNYIDKKNKIINLSSEKILKNYINSENMYENEIKDFLNAIKGQRKFSYSFQENYNNLKFFGYYKNL